MKKLALLLPLSALALAACSGQPEAQPTEAATATPTPEATPSLPAPDQETFSKLFDEACPKAEKVNQAFCKRAGFGSEEVTCEYSLGEDKYMRDEATLTPGDGAWTLKDPEATCKKHLDHHVG